VHVRLWESPSGVVPQGLQHGFPRVTLFPPCGQQSDAVQSVAASAERVISGRRNGDRRILRAYGSRPVKAYRRDGRRHVNAGGGC